LWAVRVVERSRSLRRHQPRQPRLPRRVLRVHQLPSTSVGQDAIRHRPVASCRMQRLLPCRGDFRPEPPTEQRSVHPHDIRLLHGITPSTISLHHPTCKSRSDVVGGGVFTSRYITRLNGELVRETLSLHLVLISLSFTLIPFVIISFYLYKNNLPNARRAIYV